MVRAIPSTPLFVLPLPGLPCRATPPTVGCPQQRRDTVARIRNHFTTALHPGPPDSVRDVLIRGGRARRLAFLGMSGRRRSCSRQYDQDVASVRHPTEGIHLYKFIARSSHIAHAVRVLAGTHARAKNAEGVSARHAEHVVTPVGSGPRYRTSHRSVVEYRRLSFHIPVTFPNCGDSLPVAFLIASLADASVSRACLHLSRLGGAWVSS
jgi:hypothetical protein